jgi:hypothetical protein
MNDYEGRTLCIVKITDREIKQTLNTGELI